MTLKQQYHIVVDKRKFGGNRTIVSVNKLAQYITPKRAEYIISQLHNIRTDKKRFKAQGCAIIDVYVR
jgi:hypothetical protein